MQDLIIDPEFKALIPPLSEDEYNNLKQSIIKEGCRDSLVLWSGVLIDGHNRYEICTKNNIDFNVVNKEFPSRSDAIIWIIDNQQGRRNINELTNSFLIGKRYNTEKNLAKGRPKMYNPYTINGQLIAEDSNVCRQTAINNEKFALALESIESKTGILKYEFLLGNIKTTMRDIIELNKLDTKQISRIISLAKENNISIKDADSKIKKEDRDKAIKEEQERKKREAEKRKREKEEREKEEKERLKKEREEAERLKKERLERERKEKEKREADRLEKERLAKQQEELDKKEREELERIEKEKLKKYQEEQERIQQEELERYQEEQQKLEEEKLKAFKEKQEREEHERKVAEELNNRKYAVILCDPPWRYDFAETKNREIENQYPTMDLKEIKSLDVPAGDDCVLFMWATAPKLEQAFEVLKAWGFEYKTCAVWDKEIIGMGYWFRGQHELLLVGTKGKPIVPSEENRVSSVIREKRGKHSKKPECVYEIIEKMVPSVSYLEMFARNTRDNWVSWGNQV